VRGIQPIDQPTREAFEVGQLRAEGLGRLVVEVYG
jgi:hypothetical protein